jgi:hypothetical protein
MDSSKDRQHQDGPGPVDPKKDTEEKKQTTESSPRSESPPEAVSRRIREHEDQLRENEEDDQLSNSLTRWVKEHLSKIDSAVIEYGRRLRNIV